MHDVGMLVNLSVSLVAALALGLLTERLGLSPILGYLLAGIALGPQTPGFVADPTMAAQFAEIGVILLMFGVGLHFQPRDLLAVRRIAIPGAMGQILVATSLGILATLTFGGNAASGFVVGVAISVASTVVLMRVLMDNNALQSSQGHIAVGWLIVEDIFTVLVLVLLPGVAGTLGGVSAGETSLLASVGIAAVKVVALGVLVFAVGTKAVPWLLGQVASLRSRELFTLTVLALALGIATLSGLAFGVSLALGAFLAGMVVGQSEVSHQAAADALPMRDAFAVLFFVAVGMLFDPNVVLERPAYLASLLGIILLAKPLVALSIIWLLGYSVRTALTVAVGLAQIGEFSFILADLGRQLEILSSEGQSLLVTCALLSIALNPILFRAIDPFERWLRRHPWLWGVLNHRVQSQSHPLSLGPEEEVLPSASQESKETTAIVVGYGPVGQTASRILREFGIVPIVVDLNIDTVKTLTASGSPAVYGDATQREILERAGIAGAKYLLITIPDLPTKTAIIMTARNLERDLRILVRSRYLLEKEWLEEIGASAICDEESEVAAGLATLLLREVGASEERIQEETRRVRIGAGLG
jgi:CPA2 family monovalent cation:H+ antiporter-2